MWQALRSALADEERMMLWLAQLAIVSLPFSMSLNAVAVGLLVAGWLLRPNAIEKLRTVLRRKIFYLLTLPYWILVVSALWGSDWDENLSLLRITLPLLLLPLVVVGSPPLQWVQVRVLFYTLIVACLAAWALMLPVGLYRWWQSGEVKHLFYHDLASSIELHSIYLSQCVGLGLVFGLYALFFDVVLPQSHRKLLRWAVALLAVLLLMLASRMVIGVTLLGVLVLLFVRLRQRYGVWRGSVAVALAGCVALGAAWAVPYTRARFTKFFSFDNRQITQAYFTAEEYLQELPLRVVLLQHSARSLSEGQCWLYGHGLSDAQAAMDVYMRERNLLRYVGMNPHNLYMHYVMLAGVLGLAVYMGALASWGWLGWQQRRHLLLLVLGMLLLFALTESLYFRQQAVVLYSLLVSVLLHCKGMPGTGRRGQV